MCNYKDLNPWPFSSILQSAGDCTKRDLLKRPVKNILSKIFFVILPCVTSYLSSLICAMISLFVDSRLVFQSSGTCIKGPQSNPLVVVILLLVSHGSKTKSTEV